MDPKHRKAHGTAVLSGINSPLDIKIVKDRVRKREAIKGPREGDWVIMNGSLHRLGSNGIRTFSSWVGSGENLPIDSTRDQKNPNRVSHRALTTDTVFDSGGGSFHMREDGTLSRSGGNNFHDVSRRTGETKPGIFQVF
jgi:hypothetical protein